MRKQVLHPRTAAINQEQKNKSKKERLEALQWLQNTFPAAFDNRKQIRPLNIGIMQEILQHADEAALLGISKSKLREAVVLYTRRLDYLACLKAREFRIGLSGNLGLQVNEEDAERAALKIKKRVEKSIKNMKKPLETNVEKTERVKLISMKHDNERLVSIDSPKVSSVTVMHKQSRRYDPAVIARLKEKLGLSVEKTE